MKLLYKITVLANMNDNVVTFDLQYPVTFSITSKPIEDKETFFVLCKYPHRSFLCGTYSNYDKAIQILRDNMKNAMLGRYLYRRCNCFRRIYYPSNVCNDCYYTLRHDAIWWIN